MPQYFTYAQDAYNQMQPGQKVEFQSGKGYYLAGNPPATVQQATANTQAAGQPAAQGQAPVAQALAQSPTNPFETDPGYLAALAAQQAQSQQADAALRAAQEQAIVQFGDPGLAQALGINLDPLTAAMAQQNTTSGNSTVAQLQRQRDMNQQGIVNNLAAHGIINSGDLGYKTGQNQQNYGTALYNAQQGVLTSLAAQAANTAAAKAGAQSDVAKALTSAYDTYVQNPQFWGAAGDTGGSTAAANSVATQAAPVAQSLASTPTSRLASRPPGYTGASSRYQTARNSY